MSFTGEFRHTIDAKGRLIVPSRLRDELEASKVTLTVWPDGCVSMWSGEGWRKLEGELLNQARNNPQARAAVRHLFGQAHTDVVDKQGRISVPPNLRTFAAIDKDVVIVGVGDHAELWEPEKYETAQREVGEGDLGALFESLDL